MVRPAKVVVGLRTCGRPEFHLWQVGLKLLEGTVPEAQYRSNCLCASTNLSRISFKRQHRFEFTRPAADCSLMTSSDHKLPLFRLFGSKNTCKQTEMTAAATKTAKLKLESPEDPQIQTTSLTLNGAPIKEKTSGRLTRPDILTDAQFKMTGILAKPMVAI